MGKKHANGICHDKNMARNLDELADYDEFKADLLPKLREAVKAGVKGEDIMRAYESLAAARIVTIAAVEVDSSKALAAAKDILDRAQGKAKERVETTHRMAALPDEQLDAILISKLQDATSDDDDDNSAEH